MPRRTVRVAIYLEPDDAEFIDRIREPFGLSRSSAAYVLVKQARAALEREASLGVEAGRLADAIRSTADQVRGEVVP